MAIVLLGKTICPLCEYPLEENENVYVFPALISNQADPLYELNDRAFHKSCLVAHPLYSRISKVMRIWQQKTKSHECELCKNEITNPDEHFIFPYFEDKQLHYLSFAQFHKLCLAKWSGLDECIAQIDKLSDTETWEGYSLDNLLAELREWSKKSSESDSE